MPVHPRAYGEHQWPSVRVWMRSGLRDLCISFLITHKTHPTLGGGSEWVACSPKRRRGVGQDRRALRDGGEMTSHGEHLGRTPPESGFWFATMTRPWERARFDNTGLAHVNSDRPYDPGARMIH